MERQVLEHLALGEWKLKGPDEREAVTPSCSFTCHLSPRPGLEREMD